MIKQSTVVVTVVCVLAIGVSQQIRVNRYAAERAIPAIPACVVLPCVAQPGSPAGPRRVAALNISLQQMDASVKRLNARVETAATDGQRMRAEEQLVSELERQKFTMKEMLFDAKFSPTVDRPLSVAAQ